MQERRSTHPISCAIALAAVLIIALRIDAPAEDGKLVTGKSAMGDWSSDAPGVRRKIKVQDLPPPSPNAFAINRAHVIARPPDARPKGLPGFNVELYASGFRDPRFLLTAPNGDIFVVESRANQIKVLRDNNG